MGGVGGWGWVGGGFFFFFFSSRRRHTRLVRDWSSDVCSSDLRIVRSCLILAIQTDGKRVDTIEGLSDDGHLEDLQAAFHARNGLQCGFCTPGILLTAAELIETHPDANREQIRVFLSGNYCRCTGYHAIVDAIESVVRSGQEKREP